MGIYSAEWHAAVLSESVKYNYFLAVPIYFYLGGFDFHAVPSAICDNADLKSLYFLSVLLSLKLHVV